MSESHPVFSLPTSADGFSQSPFGRSDCRADSALFAAGPVAVFEWRDASLRNPVRVSGSVEELFGYPASDFLACTVSYPELASPDSRQRLAESLATAVQGQHGSVDRGPFRVTTRAGQDRWIRDHIVFSWSSRGAAKCCGYAIDVTETEKATRALSSSVTKCDIEERSSREAGSIANEAHLSSMFAQAHAGLVETRISDGRILRVNPAFCALLGYDTDELIGRRVFDITHPDDIEVSEAMLRRRLAMDRDGFQLEKRYLKKDGTPLWTLLGVGFLRGRNGQVESAIGLVQDLTERKNAELRVSRQIAISNAVAGIAERLLNGAPWRHEAERILCRLGDALGVDAAYLCENPVGAQNLVGSRKRAEWRRPGQSADGAGDCFNDFDPEDLEIRDLFSSLAQGEPVAWVGNPNQTHGYRAPGFDGFPSVLFVPMRVSGHLWGFFGFADHHESREWLGAEITALQLAASIVGGAIVKERLAARLAERERRYWLATLAGRVGIWEWDLATNLVSIDDVVQDILGPMAGGEPVAAEFWIERTHPEDREQLNEIKRQVEQGEISLLQGDFRFLTAYGQYRWLRLSGARSGRLLTDRTEAVIGTIIDITDQRVVQDALRQANEEWARTFDTVPDPVVVVDGDCRILRVNSAFCAQVGREKHDLIGTVCHLCSSRIDDGRQGCPGHEQFQQLQGPALEVAGFTSDRIFRINTAPLFETDGSVRGAVHVAHDITDEKRAEQERLSLIERQADAHVREVSHRIKNHLHGIVGLLDDHRQRSPWLSELLSGAISQVQSIAGVYQIHSRDSDDRISLHEMLVINMDNLKSIFQCAYETEIAEDRTDAWYIESKKAVTFSLIINELLLNAIKHSDCQDGTAAPRVIVRSTAFSWEMIIRNPGVLPVGFDFVQGHKLGTGLSLVRNMLPKHAVALSITEQDAHVTVRLEIRGPLARQRMR